MTNEELYCRWLACNLKQEKHQEQKYAKESFAETIQQSPAYQQDAEVNGNPQPIVATRKDTNKCDVTVIPRDTLYIGDLVKVFDEYWICIEKYIDEFGMQYAELWMCNHIFCYQDFDLNVIHKHAILDDGSYSKGNDKAIAVADNYFNCYVSLDDESRALFIDKRLGISVIYDKNGKEVLDVGKIKWVDIKSRNFGAGSHLMVFGINEDPYNSSTDNIELLICDYREKKDDKELPDISGDTETPNESLDTNSDDNFIANGWLLIDGRKTIRIGSGRTYTVSAIDKDSGKTVGAPEGIEWSVNNKGISIEQNGATCKVSVKEDDDLVGTIFVIQCTCFSGEYIGATFDVEVT